MPEKSRRRRTSGKPSSGDRVPHHAEVSSSTSPRRRRPDIKSGMTVEELKQLTKLRMKEGKPALVSTPPQTTRRARSPGEPRTKHSRSSSPASGMSMQELKQLTNLRLAAQHTRAPPPPQSSYNSHAVSPVVHVMNNAELMDAARSQLRATLDDDSTPPAVVIRAHDRNPHGKLTARVKSFIPADPSMYLSQAPAPIDTTRQDSDDDDHSDDDDKFDEDSDEDSDDDVVPPAPTTHEAKSSSVVPSWSPPASKKATMSSASRSQLASFYHTSAYEAANNEQNQVVAPPPGMTRRPSMNLPWQVAESVLRHHQQQQQQQQRHHRGGGVTSPSNRSNSSGELDHDHSRPRSPVPSSESSSSSQKLAPRRGEFGNAAEFFKFRRRSKSRLEIARDQQQQLLGIQEGAAFHSPTRNHRGLLRRTQQSPVQDKVVGGSEEEDSEEDDDGSEEPTAPPGSFSMPVVGKMKIKMGERLSSARKSIEIKDAAFEELYQHVKSSSPERSSKKVHRKKSHRSLFSPSSAASRPPPGLSTRLSRRRSSKNLEERLSDMAKRVASCAASGDTAGFNQALAGLDRLKVEASSMLQPS